MNTPELTAALFSAEAVAHLQGYEREILPLTDLARGMAAHIEELRAALKDTLTICVSRGTDLGLDDGGPVLEKARAVLAKTPEPLAPEMTRA